jgi:pSer/pThr/pTyr-binding forkhead associated (FHA) protein
MKEHAMWITIASPGQDLRSVQLELGRHIVGRAHDCDVTVADSHVSGQHAQLDVVNEGAWVTDLGSTNGTFVDGCRLLRDPVLLPAHGEFVVGTTTVKLTASEPTMRIDRSVDTTPTSFEPQQATPFAPPEPRPPAEPARRDPSAVALGVHDAGPVAGGNVSMSGRDVVGRDYNKNIYEGFKFRSRMRGSAKFCIRFGCLLMLAGLGVLGYFIIKWNSKIFDAITEPNAEPPDDLPQPLPWLPLGAVLSFTGLVLVVTGLLIPRDRIIVPDD